MKRHQRGSRLFTVLLFLFSAFQLSAQPATNRIPGLDGTESHGAPPTNTGNDSSEVTVETWDSHSDQR